MTKQYSTDKKYTNIEDILEVGEHVLKVSPKQEWENNKPVEGSHKKGVSKGGFEWWMYSCKIGDEWINVFANTKNKQYFDSGYVVAVVKSKYDEDTGEPFKKVFFNEHVQGSVKKDKLDHPRETNYACVGGETYDHIGTKSREDDRQAPTSSYEEDLASLPF